MSKVRAIIDLNKIDNFSNFDIQDLYHEGKCEKISLIQVDSEPTNFDSEKGYQTSRVIFMHTTTKIYYEGELEDWGSGEYEYGTILTQVFPRRITKTIYN